MPSTSRTLAASSASCAVSTAVSKPKHLSICGAHATLSFTVNISAILATGFLPVVSTAVSKPKHSLICPSTVLTVRNQPLTQEAFVDLRRALAQLSDSCSLAA